MSFISSLTLEDCFWLPLIAFDHIWLPLISVLPLLIAFDCLWLPLITFDHPWFNLWLLQSCPCGLPLLCCNLAMQCCDPAELLVREGIICEKRGGGGSDWFHASILFFQTPFKHTSNTLQHPSNTLKTPIKKPSNNLQNHLFFSLKKWTEKNK